MIARKKSSEEFGETIGPETLDCVIRRVFDTARADTSVKELKLQLRKNILNIAYDFPRAAYFEEKIDNYVAQVFEEVNGDVLDIDYLKTQALAFARIVFPELYKRC